MRKLALIVMFVAALTGQAWASNYYVETPANGGDNGNTGALGSPWATVTYALAHIGGSDTLPIVIIGQGTYAEGSYLQAYSNLDGKTVLVMAKSSNTQPVEITGTSKGVYLTSTTGTVTFQGITFTNTSTGETIKSACDVNTPKTTFKKCTFANANTYLMIANNDAHPIEFQDCSMTCTADLYPCYYDAGSVCKTSFTTTAGNTSTIFSKRSICYLVNTTYDSSSYFTCQGASVTWGDGDNGTAYGAIGWGNGAALIETIRFINCNLGSRDTNSGGLFYAGVNVPVGYCGLLEVRGCTSNATTLGTILYPRQQVRRVLFIGNTLTSAYASSTPIGFGTEVADEYTTIDGATWTDASKTLTKASAFSSYTWKAGDFVIFTGGDNVVQTKYTVASKTDASNIVLSADINGGSGNISNASIAARLYAPVEQISPYPIQQVVVDSNYLTFTSTDASHCLFIGKGAGSAANISASGGSNAVDGPPVYPVGATITNNTILAPNTTLTMPIICAKGDGVYIYGNKVYAPKGTWGIYIAGGSGCTVDHNTVWAKKDAFAIATHQDSWFSTLSHPNGYATFNRVTNNIFMTSDPADAAGTGVAMAYCRSDWHADAMSPVTTLWKNYIDYNLYYTTGTYVAGWWGSPASVTLLGYASVVASATAQYDAWAAYAPSDPIMATNDLHSKFGNPLLNSPSTGDFSIKGGSPAWSNGYPTNTTIGAWAPPPGRSGSTGVNGTFGPRN